MRNSRIQHSVSQCHPIYSVIFLAKGKTPTEVGLSGKWTKTDWSICAHSRLVFDVSGNLSTNGSNVQIYSYNATNAQRFWFYTADFEDVNMWVRTAQHSVSQWCLIAHNSGTSYAPYSADDLSKYKMVSLVAATKDYRPLASTVFMIDFLTMYCTSADKAAACVYAPEPNAYSANVYYQNSKIYIKSTSTWDRALLIAF